MVMPSSWLNNVKATILTNMKNRVWLVGLLATIVFSANIWGYPIYILDEAKNAACAMEMYQRGDWVVPTFNDSLRTDKPPLHYFFMIIAYHIFGVSPFSARLFQVLMGIGIALMIYFIARKSINERTGFLSALIFICSLQASVQFHMAVPDPFLIAFITSAIFCFYYAWIHQRANYFYLCYASVALAFLAKGPVAVVLTGLPIFIFLIWRKEFTWSTVKKLKLLQGIVLFLVIVSPWWIAVTIQTNGEWVKGFLFDHNLNRFSSTMEGHKGIPGIAIVTAFLALLPLSFFLPQAINIIRKKLSEYSITLMALLTCLVVILFFSVSRTFLPGYIGPCLPFASILIGFYLDQWISKNSVSTSQWISFSIGALISIIIPLAGYFALKMEFKNEALAQKALFLLPICIGAIFSFIFLLKKQVEKSLHTTLYSYLISSVFLFYFIIPHLINQNPVTKLASQFEGEKDLAIFKSTNSAFVFNTKHIIPVLENQEQVNDFIQRYPNSAILSRISNLDQLDTVQFFIYKEKDLFENPVTVVLKRKN